MSDMRKKLLYVLNARAGHGQVEGALSEIIDTMVRAGYETRVHTTQGPGDATDIISSEGDGSSLIVCSGGDGTLDEAVAGILKLGQDIPIGYIPAGSTNDFAHSLGLPDDIRKAADVAVNGSPVKCDIGSFNGRSFVYVAAFGLFTAASYSTPQNLKNAFGHAAYLFQGARELSEVKAYRAAIVHDGEGMTGEFILGMVTNSSYIGGFTGILGKDIELNDGQFEVTLIRKPNNLLELNEILPALFDVSLLPNMRPDIVERFKATEMSITTEEELPWTLDGEYGGETMTAVIKNMHGAVRIMR